MKILVNIDGDDNIIAQDTRGNIYKKGLFYREICVWFYALEGEITF